MSGALRSEGARLAWQTEQPVWAARLVTVTAMALWLLSTMASACAARERQELLKAITKAGHAYWDQRVVIDHPNGNLFGYSGSQTVVNPPDAGSRYYQSDSGWIPEPHIFQESEDSKGHPGVSFGFTRAYEATGDKFLKRAAKRLGDTLVSAQRENMSGGWWYDMGVVGYDRQPGSPTYRQTLE